MKKITYVALLLLLVTQLTYSQEAYKKVSINATPNAIQQLDDEGIDLTCGVIIRDNKIDIELNQYQLDNLTNKGIPYTVLIEDMVAFYSQRAIADLPRASRELQQMKATEASYRSYSVDEVLNNVGQYSECEEMDWAVPANWNLNDAANYPTETNHFGGCLTNEMVENELDAMRAQYPGLISVKSDASLVSGESDIAANKQTTFEGRTVYYVRISNDPNVDNPDRPETLYQSLIHSREAATVMNQLYFMWYLLENYATDPAIQNLLNNQELYFVPVFNPDGFVYNQTEAPDGGGGQRKNRNTTASGTCSQYVDGIDLNRNSAYYWGNGGSSDLSCNDTYMGTGPFSENETQIMRDFFLDHDFKLALNHHSYKNAMLHAYAGVNQTNPRPDEYAKYNHDMSYYNRYMHGPSTNVTSLNSGNMNDWMLGGPAGTSANGTPTGTGSGKNTMSWTPENGLYSEGTASTVGTYGGFWPKPSNYVHIAKRAMRMNFLAAYYSGKYAKLHDFNQSDISALNGDLKFAVENLGQTASDFTVTVTAVSNNIATISTNPGNVGGSVTESFSAAQVLEQRNINIGYTLDPSIQTNDKIEFKVVLTNNYATDNVLYEANIIKHYTPSVLFDGNALSSWSQTTGTWFTTSDAYSSTALTTTNGGSYADSDIKRIQMNGSVDLTGLPTAVIQFYGKWDLERSFDYVQLEGSTNGTNWTPLCGKLTKQGAPDANNNYSQKSGTDNDFQPDYEPLYDGDTQGKWNMEEVVIDATTNSFLYNQGTVYLRFEFRTDSDNRNDTYYNMDFEGFSFDDFKVIGIQIPCETTVPTGLEVSSVTTSSATVAWDNIPSATYDLRYRVIGAATWTEITDINAVTYDITGLTFNDYEVQISTRCTTSTSAYSDSVNFTISQCIGDTVSVFPYNESFESGLGLWTQGTINEIDWTRFSGLTPSNTGSNPINTTGPSAASDGSYYMYTESSSSNNNKEAYLVSPCIQLNGIENALLTFDYHMFGTNMGTLTVEVSTDNGVTYTSIFTRSGNHPNQNANNDPWITEPIDLSAYDDQTIKLRFYGHTGSNHTSDISIDNINITVAPVAVCQNITVQLDSAGNATIVPADVDGGSTDDVAITNYSIDISSFDCSNVGTPVDVILTVTDADNLSDTCTAVVTVEDSVDPLCVTQNITVELDVTGNASITANEIDNGSSDNCGLSSFSVTPSNFNSSNMGENTVLFTVSDVNGNSVSCNAIVTVIANTLEVTNFNYENVTIKPNPFNTGITIHLPSNLNTSEFEISIYDLNGRAVLTQRKSAMEGSIKIDNLNQLEQAPYFIKIRNTENGTTLTKRLIKN